MQQLQSVEINFKKKEADPLKSERKFKEKGFLVRRESLDVTEGTLR